MRGSTRDDDRVDVTVVRDQGQLAAHASEWRELASEALESNVFYEATPLLLALRHLSRGRSWLVLLLRQRGRLIGLVPLQHRAIGDFSTSLVLELLRHPHSFLHTPLVHRDAAPAAIDAWLGWAGTSSRPVLLHCQRVSADGPVFRLLAERARSRGLSWLERHAYERPSLVPDPTGDGDLYLRKALSGDRRRELGRQRRLLQARGELTVQALRPDEDCGPWTEAFLDLEARGWKGAQGSALASDPRHARFFRALTTGLHAEGRLTMLGLKLDGRWIAVNSLLCASGPDRRVFAFKTAYDETLRNLAPGILLETETVRHLHARTPAIGIVDSCTAPGRPVIGALWRERTRICNLALAPTGGLGRLALGRAPEGCHVAIPGRAPDAGPGRPTPFCRAARPGPHRIGRRPGAPSVARTR